MGNGFLKLKHDAKKLSVVVFCFGMSITIILGIQAMVHAKFQEQYIIERPKPGEDAIEKEIVAYFDNGEKVSVKVHVEEKNLSEEEVKNQFQKAEQLLDDLVLGENESREQIIYDLNFPESVPGTSVEVDWVYKPLEYVNLDGTLKENVEILESVSQEVSAILSCQEYTKDFKLELTFLPKKQSLENEMEYLVQQTERELKDQDIFFLPTSYEGIVVQWKEKVDLTFLYFFFFTISAVIFLQLGAKRDVWIEQQKRKDCLEREYAQIVSKFAMLLSAGLSVRNAWIRIVMMSQEKSMEQNPIYDEMSWAIRQMQKGVPELEVYESFGVRVALIHYKKLMALFISDKRKGSRNLLDAMNDEMLQAWEEKRRKTKQQGEQIGTKLLLPMMGMLSGVFIIILVPAFLSFGM